MFQSFIDFAINAFYIAIVIGAMLNVVLIPTIAYYHNRERLDDLISKAPLGKKGLRVFFTWLVVGAVLSDIRHKPAYLATTLISLVTYMAFAAHVANEGRFFLASCFGFTALVQMFLTVRHDIKPLDMDLAGAFAKGAM